MTTTLIAAALVMSGCKSEPDATATATACAPGGPGATDPGPCDPDPLRTNLPPLWNDLSVDIDDCPILELTPKYNEPDAMIFKAMAYVESRFQYDAIGCEGRGPCCPGWAGPGTNVAASG